MNEETINKLETLHNKIYKETEEYGRTQFVSRIVDLEHNWNELKKWLEEEEQEYRKDSYSGEYGWIIGTMVRVLNKMQELEEGGNNE